MSKPDKNKTKKEYAVDVVKDLLAWIVVTVIAFFYWMAMLLLISLFLVHVWYVTFEKIVGISIVLTIITSIGYIGVLVYRRRH